MQFQEVIGQLKAKESLTEMVSGNRLSHALFFLAKEGTGGLPMALAFSQYLVCEKVGQSLQPAGPSLFGEPEEKTILTDSCGICPACQKAKGLVHPDIHYSFPVIPKKEGQKPVSNDYITEWREFVSRFPYGNTFDWLQFLNAENKQGNITAEECNDIIRKLSIKSFESEYKILIIWMPEYLGKEGNKLLKLIEEPPPNTLFILVAENESLILPTIISRTQLVKIPYLETRDIEEALMARAGITQHEARQVASISEGNYREALQLLNHSAEDWLSLLREWLNATVKTNTVAQVRWVDEISKLGREKQKQYLRYCNHIIEQAIRASLIEGVLENLPDSEKDFIPRLNRQMDISQLQIIIEEMDKASYYIERNANAKMLFMALTIKLRHIIANKSLILVN